MDGIGAHLHPGRHPAVNIADRRGRKNAMFYALVLMGFCKLRI